MRKFKVLIRKTLRPIDARRARAITFQKVPTLKHKLLDLRTSQPLQHSRHI